jgi:hypothetical protein
MKKKPNNFGPLPMGDNMQNKGKPVRDGLKPFDPAKGYPAKKTKKGKKGGK